MTRRSRSGFTLIELIIVVGIIAVLAIVLIAVLLSAQKSGEVSKARNFVNTLIPAAITKWQEETGKTPSEYPRSGTNQKGEYYDGTAILYEELVTKPATAGKGAWVAADHFVIGTHKVNGKEKPVFFDPWGRCYIYRNFSAKKARGASDAVYNGKKYNDTYDIISAGPDGLFDNEDDVYNGSN